MKIAPVMNLMKISSFATLCDQCEMECTPIDKMNANRMIGNPVPTPYINGKMIPNSLLSAKGIKLPKNNAAEIGQNERAKINPKANAPSNPEFANFC